MTKTLVNVVFAIFYLWTFTLELLPTALHPTEFVDFFILLFVVFDAAVAQRSLLLCSKQRRNVMSTALIAIKG